MSPRFWHGSATASRSSARLLSTQEGKVTFRAFVGIVTLLATFVAGDLVQWPRPSVAHHVVLVGAAHWRLVLHPLARAGAGQLDQGERGAADGGDGLRLVLCLLWKWGLLRGSHGQLKTRVHKFAGFSFWTEAHQIVDTDYSSRVSVSAVRAVFAEASVVPGTVFDFGLWIDVQEGTFFVATLSKL